MITLEDKLSFFHKIVFKEEEEKCKKLLQDTEERNNSIIKEKKDSLEKKKRDMLNRRLQLAKIHKNEMVSKAIQESRDRALTKRQEALEDLIFSLEERGRQFTSSKDYKAYILSNIEKTLNKINDKEVIIYVRENDKCNLEESIMSLNEKNGVKITLRTTEKDIIGGFIISDENETYNLDNSFKTIIEENKYLIGKTLYKSLEEAGDALE